MRWMKLGACLMVWVACGDETAHTSETEASTTTSGSATSGDSASVTSAPPASATTDEPETTSTSGATETTGTTTAPTTGEPTTDSTTEVEVSCREVVIEDPALEKVIRKALEIPEGPIPVEAAATLEDLLGTTVVQSLAGLECFKNLRTINLAGPDLAGTEIDDLSPLAGLTQLESIFMPNALVTDLGPLAGLTQLERLGIDGNPLTSLAPLVGLPVFTSLSVNQVPAAALTDLDQLVHLEVLQIEKCGLADISDLAALSELSVLWMSGNGISDLGPLAGLTALQTIHADDNAIADLGPLAGLSQLDLLDLVANEIVDVGPLAGLVKLERLDLSHNHVVDVTPLGTLATIFVLDLADNAVVDVAPLADASTLSSLSLANNPLAQGLAELAGHPNLSQLDLTATGMKTLHAFAPATLEYFTAADNAIVDLSPLQASQVLVSLDVRGNPITTLAPIVDDPWFGHCIRVYFDDDALDAESIDEIIPAVCDSGWAYLEWGEDMNCIDWMCWLVRSSKMWHRTRCGRRNGARVFTIRVT